MIQAILFDLDGTLVNTLPLYIKSYRKALLEQGLNFSDKEIVDKCFGKTEITVCKELGISSKTEEFRKTFFAGVRRHYIEGPLFNDVIDFLNLAQEKQIKLVFRRMNQLWLAIAKAI